MRLADFIPSFPYQIRRVVIASVLADPSPFSATVYVLEFPVPLSILLADPFG
jgi:hypothetical protein